MLIFNFVAVCVAWPLCPILLPSLNGTTTPLFFFFFSLLLSSGRLDYVAKEIFLFLFFFFFAFFTVSHWFGVNAFWMPLGVCRALGEEGSTGSCRVEEFQSEAVRWGSVWVKAQREALKWELKWFAEPRNLSDGHSPSSSASLFQGHSFTGSPQVHCQSFLFKTQKLTHE